MLLNIGSQSTNDSKRFLMSGSLERQTIETEKNKQLLTEARQEDRHKVFSKGTDVWSKRTIINDSPEVCIC